MIIKITIIILMIISSGINAQTIFEGQQVVPIETFNIYNKDPWIWYNQINPCQDVNVTDASQYPLDDQLYNVIVGEDVIINCNYTISSGQQLDIVAKNSIMYGPGFSAKLGSLFSAKIEPVVCDSILNSASVSNMQDALVSEMNMQTKEIIIENKDIQVFPNPNDGKFMIDFGSNEYDNFKIVITDIGNKLVYSSEKLNSSVITIELKNNPNGVYILTLFNKLHKKVITHKIIIQ